jgi:hypothetical protein
VTGRRGEELAAPREQEKLEMPSAMPDGTSSATSQGGAIAQKNEGYAVLSVIYLLGAFALLGLIGALVLTYVSLKLPQNAGTLLTPLFTLVGSAVGGLGSMLASTRSSPLQAQVVNPPGEPVKTEVVNQPDAPIPTHEEGREAVPGATPAPAGV